MFASTLDIAFNLSNSTLSKLFSNGVSFIIFLRVASTFNHEYFAGSALRFTSLPRLNKYTE